ncbi:MAG: DUF4254 domain-containing protein [Legionellales bacterium]|nr:DUF4254 domain-containing protein [Legionellales bacterium]
MLTHLTSDIVKCQRESIINWKKTGVMLHQIDFLKIVEENHAFNYQLWHAEDRARRDDLGFEHVYHAKREIDHCNQQRNDRMEAMDTWLLQTLHPAPPGECPIHSETPGMMIDRLSILSLKVYHMGLQTLREDVPPSHHQACLNKWHSLKEQGLQLQEAFSQLLLEMTNRTRTFKIHYQYKMYNDPALNPEMYEHLLPK